MTLRRKLLLAMLIPAALLAVLGAVGVYSLRDLRRAAGRILADNYRSIQQARRMSEALRRIERAGNVPVAGNAFVQALRVCEGNITEAGEPAVLRRIRRAWASLRRSHGLRQGLQADVIRPGTLLSLHRDIEALVVLNEQAMIRHEQTTRRVGRIMIGAAAGSALAALAALAVFALVAAKWIAGPVTDVSDRLHRALNPVAERNPARLGPAADEISRLRQELDALLDRLACYEDDQSRRLDEARRRFISMLSHQLKTPMTSLSMSVNLLKEKLGGHDAAHAELLAIAAQDCRTLSALVSDLIEAARDAPPDLTLKRQRVDIVRLLRSALRPIAPQAAEKGITLVIRAGDQELPASVDPVKFPWVVTNIVGNALRYTKAGGRIEVSVCAAGAGIEVRVNDTGAGIAAENLPRIFQPYVSLDEEPELGTHGLGLAIAREIVQAHGASIEATSELGVGTEFRILLPASTEHRA